MVPSVRLQHALRIELLPPIFVVRVCGHCLGLGHLRLAGLHVPVDADRRREEVARHAQLGCRVRHVNVDQHAVVHDLALGRVDESHPAHVRGQLVHLVERAVAQRQCRAAVRRLTQVQHTELVGRGRGKLVLLDIHAAHPIALSLQLLDQVSADETTRSTYDCFFHAFLSARAIANAMAAAVRTMSTCSSFIVGYNGRVASRAANLSVTGRDTPG